MYIIFLIKIVDGAILRWIKSCVHANWTKYDIIMYYPLQTLTTPQQQELPVLEEEEVEEESHDKEDTPLESEEPTGQPAVEDDQSCDQNEDKPANQNNETLSEFLSNEVAYASSRHKAGVLPPHGLPCLRELLRFLISIINTTDR